MDRISMTRQQREALMDRVDVLQKVKALLLLPGICMVTVMQLADYFEETADNIRKCYYNHKEELDRNGVCTLKADDLEERIGKKFQSVNTKSGKIICIDDSEYIEINHRGSLFFPPRAILNLGMLLPKSRVALEIRTQLLNITEKATPKQRVEAIGDEQELLNNIGRAFATGDISAFAEAAAQYSGYLNRNLTKATSRIEALTKEKASLNEVNAMLAEKAMVWEPRPTLNALIRAIAVAAFNHKYSLAWEKFYRELKYRTGIHIFARTAGEGGSALDAVRDEEWPQLMKVAASLCYDYAVDVVYATNEETVRQYNLDTIETEFGIRHNTGMRTWRATEPEMRNNLSFAPTT